MITDTEIKQRGIKALIADVGGKLALTCSALRASQPAAAVDCARRQASLPTCSRLIRGD